MVKIDAEQRIAVVEPGVINLDVTRAVAPYGLYFAPDPSSQSICTIGGNIAFNSGGAHCLKYGMTSNHVLGIKAVLPDGEVVSLGSTSLEGVGPDLVDLFGGSEGLFGVALEITLRLLSKPERFRTVLVAYHNLELAGEAGAYERAEALAGEILEMCIAFGGSITGEHGVGMEKKAYLPSMSGPDDVATMQRIRHAIDPLEISDPGKMFPGGDAPSLSHAGPHPLEKVGVISRE